MVTGLPECEVERVHSGRRGRRVVDAAVDETVDRSAGLEVERIVALAADQVGDRVEGVAVERAAAGAADGPGIGGVAGRSPESVPPPPSTPEDRPARLEFEVVVGGAADQRLDAGERVDAAERPAIGAVDDPVGVLVGSR